MKDQNFFKVLDAVVKLEVLKGHLRWKMSDLSRISGVQRTLVYYYFGKSKEMILQTAMKGIGDEFFGLSDERLELWKSGKIKESILRTREMMKKAPHVTQFYFHWRHQDNEIAKHLASLEKRYTRKVKELFPNVSDNDAQAVFAIFFGLVVTPDLNEAVIDQILKGMRFPI